MGLYTKYRYRTMREELVKLTQGTWHTYYIGNLSAARAERQDADLIGRLARGLQVAGLVLTTQKRNSEGLMEYKLFTKEKLSEEDLDAAMDLTGRKGEAYIPPLEPER
jgi:hypothetical protein